MGASLTARLQLADDELMRAIQTRLQSAKLNLGKTAFERLQTELGWKISPLLTD